MPADVNEQPPPGETGSVADGGRPYDISRRRLLQQLKERLEPAEHAVRPRRGQHGPFGRHLEGVALVLVRLLYESCRLRALHGQRDHTVRPDERQTGLLRDPSLHSLGRTLEPGVLVAGERDIEAGIERQPARLQGHGLRHRHQRMGVGREPDADSRQDGRYHQKAAPTQGPTARHHQHRHSQFNQSLILTRTDSARRRASASSWASATTRITGSVFDPRNRNQASGRITLTPSRTSIG